MSSFIQGLKMKNFRKLNGVALRAGFVSTAVFLSSHALAGTYTSTVQLPTLHSKNYVYTAHVPVPAGVGSGFIKNISWNWNVHGWPRGLQVYLCQTSTRCIDVSRQRVGSKATFTQFHASQPFFYELKLSDPGRVPVAGLLGKLTVNW
ncbi:flagellar protein FlhE [Pseudomonas abietaniphila]|uniref:flagellar protein FlhE n=1 Tax=Pseudomonas abietaniphila TaxID=89065 RepID=UPI003216F093